MKKLAIIGASYLQKPLVLKAKEMGIETHCFAWEEGAVCKEIADWFYPISIVEKEIILEKCKEVNIDAITSIASDLAIPTISFIAQKLGLVSNSSDCAQVATNKYKMRQRFAKFGVNSPRFAYADADTTDLAISDFKFPLIVKPTDRSGSRGVFKVENRNDLTIAIKRAKEISFSKEAIIEEYIAGTEVSVETITWNGKHYILAITDKVTTEEPYFVELEHHQPSILKEDVLSTIRQVTLKAIEALNIKYGASHTEIKITSTGEVYVIEVGARMGGDFIGSDLVQLSTGYDFVKAVIQVALGYFEKPIFKEINCAGVYFLSQNTKYIKQYIDNYSKYPEIISARITDDILHELQNSADRSGYFIYQSNKRMKI